VLHILGESLCGNASKFHDATLLRDKNALLGCCGGVDVTIFVGGNAHDVYWLVGQEP
jgi:hypothetical protein